MLVAPEIATNTGNIIRLCANTGARLHLVEPLGFSLDAASLRRAGLDYHELAEVVVHPDLATCLGSLPSTPDRRFALSAHGATRYDRVELAADDTVVFGAERSGLANEVLSAFPIAQRLRLPMRPNNRSLNLANAVAVVVYEAWRAAGFPGAGDDAGASLAESTVTGPFERPR